MATLDAEFDAGLKGPSLVIWMSAAALGVFIFWAAIAWVDEIVRAPGEVMSSSRPQIIQNLEGGILAELLVAEGDRVEPGAVIARLHGTEFRSTVTDYLEQIAALEIKRLRLDAELAGRDAFNVPADLAARTPHIVTSERALLAARQADFISRRDGAKQVLNEAAQELKLLEDMLDQKIVALIEVTRARKAYADALNRHNDIITQTELDRAKEFSEVLKEQSTLRQNLKIAQDQLDRTVLTSPMRGIVNNLAVTTIGGVVRPGEEIAEIIPLGDEILVEARVKPEDVANVQPGQQATVKLSAYDYTIYGSFKGTVSLVSADTFKDDRVRDGDPHYRVTLSLDLSGLTERQKQLEIRPGMVADVELHTGSKTILRYLLKPLYKSREAFREP
ncbi:HlyD family efflux transporter periplasmic adaptor subunit [Maritimibacter sp. UBA3975]|uniref:HlyD family efflux transporter periplasmic adaptor subunit n=1 Tax=Maritimibacter sp. UBA3975 TaxID=1946833 RepID=UPI000C08EAB4|nr:HlyD family efflux transporter periplasmic adaptor subunit [Maritimibacter sp. UBA3975]MAM63600.1 transporter [Maritimibacter sp.]|tara:strand:- start:4 stop:1173 length:1170 start_codon:yes stop_codon:yes gene_type:complete